MFRFILAVFFGSLVMFAWNFISWSVLPWHDTVINSFNEEQRVVDTLQNSTQADGVYVIPADSLNVQIDTFTGSNASSINFTPFAFVAFTSSQGKNLNQQITTAAVTSIALCTIFTLLLCCTIDLNYVARVLFITMIGVACAVATHIPYWNWFHFETNYTLIMMADFLIGSFLAAITIAIFIGSRSDEEML